MIGIYKITNKITKQCYIGQSVHIERRWEEHCRPSATSLISKAIKEYGKENFIFEIIEECSANQLAEKEQYWITFYNSLVPNGYNVAEAGFQTIHTIYATYDKKTLYSIIQDLKNNNLTMKEIANKYSLNVSTISRINKGTIHKQNGIKYPIRNTQTIKPYIKKCIDCGKIISHTAIRCTSCDGKFKASHNVLPVSREQLKQLIRNIPFTQIAKLYNVTDNAIRKWCDKYSLPRNKKDINNYSDAQWLKI